MTSCEAARPAPLRCPTDAEVLESALALLPQGRAWQSNEGGPAPGYGVGFDPGGFRDGAFATTSKQGSILRAFWKAVADVYAFVNTRLCALRLEFWCATQSETRDLWMAEYGLPDACDPFPDLCTKVAALGGARCEYFNEIVSRVGWTIDCDDQSASCGDQMGCSVMGAAQMGAAKANTLRITVHTHESPAYTSGPQTPPLMGLMQMGMPITCGPDITPLECLIDRIAPAHVTIEYILEN